MSRVRAGSPGAAVTEADPGCLHLAHGMPPGLVTGLLALLHAGQGQRPHAQFSATPCQFGMAGVAREGRSPMLNGDLPEDGDLRLGSLRLRGRRVGAALSRGRPVAWVTEEPVPDAGGAWLALSAMAADTGLRPVLEVPSVPGGSPGEAFYNPVDVADISRLSAAAILARLWEDKTADGGDDLFTAQYQPFSGQFPGLAARSGEQPDRDGALRALDSVPPARICLAAASRPADLLAVIGWNMTDAWDSALPVCAVLRSWEDRFGARLLQIGPGAEIRLLVDRPPRTTAAAQRIAAEQWAFCSAWIDQDSEDELTAISEIAPRLLNAPIWGFWWD